MARRNTRELILETSLALFNELGEPNVSTNLVADEADISPGNLYYHFRSKDDLALELFKRYLLEMQPLLEVGEAGDATIEELVLRLHMTFEIMGRYRFLYRNLTDLHTRIPNLRQAFNGLLGRQRSNLVNRVHLLQTAGIMNLADEHAEPLVDNALLLMTYWIPMAEIQGDPGLQDGSTLPHAVARVLYLFVPHLKNPEAELLEGLARDYLQS